MSKYPLEDSNLIAVYGTLKQKWLNWKPYGNHSVMIHAWWVFVKKAWVPFDQLAWYWFPTATFNSTSNKLLGVELWRVSRGGIWSLDSLEWHPCHYYRKKVITQAWDECIIYEYNHFISDESEKYLYKSDNKNKYYIWNNI